LPGHRTRGRNSAAISSQAGLLPLCSACHPPGLSSICLKSEERSHQLVFRHPSPSPPPIIYLGSRSSVLLLIHYDGNYHIANRMYRITHIYLLVFFGVSIYLLRPAMQILHPSISVIVRVCSIFHHAIVL